MKHGTTKVHEEKDKNVISGSLPLVESYRLQEKKHTVVWIGFQQVNKKSVKVSEYNIIK